MSPHTKQERLKGLSGTIDADIRQGACRQETANGVQRLGANSHPVGKVSVLGRLGKLLGGELHHFWQELGVRVEHAVHLADVLGSVL